MQPYPAAGLVTIGISSNLVGAEDIPEAAPRPPSPGLWSRVRDCFAGKPAEFIPGPADEMIVQLNRSLI